MGDEDLLLNLAKTGKPAEESPLLTETPAQAAAKGQDDILDTLAQQQGAEKDAAFRTSLTAAKGVVPDKAAEAHRMAKASGLPMEVVERQTDLVRQNLEDEQILNSLAEAPRTRDFMSEGDNLKLAKDDVSYLTGFEWLMAATRGGVKEGNETVRSSALNFESIFGPLTAEKEQELRGLREAEQKRGGSIKNFGADGWFENAAVEASRQLPILWNTIKAGGAGSVAGAGIGSLAALVVGQAGPQAGTPEEFATVPLFARTGARWGGGANVARAVFELESGQAYGEFSAITDEDGNLIDQDVAKVGALVYGGVAAGLELFSLKKVLETVPGGKKLLGQLTKERVKEAMKDKVFRTTLLEFVKNSGKAITAETLTEVMQEASQVFIGEMAKVAAPGDFENASADEITQRLTNTFVATLQSMSIIGPAGPGASFVIDNMKAMKAKNTQATLDILADTATNSKLSQRTPDKFFEFVKAAKTEGGLTDVYVDAGKFIEYFQSQAIDPEQFAQGLQIEDDLKNAAEAGNVLRIPLEQYMTKIANTAHHEALKRSVKFAPQDMTLDEADAFDATRAEELQRVINDSQRELAELQEEERLPVQLKAIRDKLVTDREKGGAGVRAEDADAQVRLLLAGARALSKESGETVDDWFARVNPVLKVSSKPGIAGAPNTLNQRNIDYTNPVNVQYRDTIAAGGGEFIGTQEGFDGNEGLVWFNDTVTGSTLALKPSQVTAEAVKNHIEESRKKFKDAEGLKAEDGKFFQSEKIKDGDALVSLHNLSEDNLRHADKLGGLAVPSVSIGKESDPLSGFGEVSLVAPQSLVDPRVSKLTKLFNADIYSPRYPSVRYNTSSPALDKVNKRFKKEGDELGRSFWSDLDSHSFEYKGVEAIKQSAVAQLAFLRQQGVKYVVPAKKAETPTLDLNPGLKKFLGNGYEPVGELGKNPGFLEAYEKARQAERKKFIEGTVKDGSTEAEAVALYEDLFKGVWYDEDGSLSYTVVNLMNQEVNNLRDDGRPDYYKASSDIRDLVAKQQAEFDKFAQALFTEILKDERIISETQTSNGNRRFLPHTLDNVVREMKRHLNDGEGFNYGIGSIRSVVAKRFTSLAQVKADRSKLVTEEQMEALKEEGMEIFSGLADRFKRQLKTQPSNTFGWLDTFSEHLKEMVTRGTKAVMDDYYDGYLPAELLQEAKDFLNKLRNMDTEYFEAKIQRAVGLNEFAAALVPDNATPETLEVLKKNGIKDVVLYKRNQGKDGNQGRVEALKALKKKRPDLFFQDDKAVKGSVEFTDAATIITLFKSADFSTFLHESGHIFMREMGKVVASGKASAQLQADYKALTEYVGGDITTREAQEKLARAFEAYLREGKAPSIKLTSAFQRFRDWLMKIYKEVRKLNVELTDEVRGVFDRMLASEAELAEAQHFYRSKQSLLDFINPTPEQRADLTKKRKAAEGTALDKQVAKHLRSYFDAIGGQGQIKKDAEKAINERPVYRMVDAVIEAGGVNVDDVRKAYGKEVVAQIQKQHPGFLKRTDAKAKGLGTFAAQFDFASPDDAIQAVIKAVKKKDAIKNLTADLLKEKEEDIRRDLSAQERMGGEEAVHNDASLTYLLAEANLLLGKLDRARAIRPDQLEARLYKDTAKTFLQKKKVKEATRYDVYAKAEQRYAKAAFAAAEKGDLTAAYDFKVKQALNHALVQEAIRLRDEKAEIENYFKLKNFKSKLKNVENAFMEVAVDLATTYGFVPEDALPIKSKDPVFKMADLDEVLAAQTPDFILRKERPNGFKSYRDLTYQQFREVADTVKAVVNFGNDTLKSAEAGEEQSRQAVIDASVLKMQALKDRVNSKLNELRDESSRASKLVGLADGFVADATMVQFLSDWMDGFQFMTKGTFGPMRTLYNKVLDAEKRYMEMRTDVFKQSKVAWETLGKAVQRIHADNGNKITIPDVPVNEDMRRTKRGYWSGQRMLAVLLNSGNAGNLNAIQKGYSFTPAQIQKIASYFTEAELKAVQVIWDVTESLYPQLDATHFAIYNRHIEKVGGQPVTFTSKDGKQVKLDGGYYPLIFDHMLNDRAAQFFEEDMMKNQTQAVVRSTKPEDGFSYSRVPGHSLPPLLDTSVWFRHINNVSRYITHARVLRDMNVITRDPEWAREVKKRAGHDHYKALRSWLQYQANPGRTENQGILDWSRGVMTAMALGFKNAVGLKQRADVLKGIRAIGGKDLTKGWRYVGKAYTQLNWKSTVLGTSHNDSWQDIIKRSSYVRTRDGNIDREISDLRDRLNPFAAKRVTIAGKEFTARDIQDAAYFWIKMNDRAAVSVVWTAAYNKFIAENADPKQSPAQQDKAAIAYADGIIQDTQASSLKAELSAIQRGEFKGLSRDMIKLFTAFMTESLKYGNRSMQNYRAWSNGSITTKEFLHHIILEQVITPWTALMLGVAGKFGDLPEWWDFLLEPVYTFISWIPLVRDGASYLQYGMDKIGDTTLTEPLRRIFGALKGVGLFVIGEKDFDDALWDAGKLVEVVTKVPALNFVKEVQNAVESISGD